MDRWIPDKSLKAPKHGVAFAQIFYALLSQEARAEPPSTSSVLGLSTNRFVGLGPFDDVRLGKCASACRCSSPDRHDEIRGCALSDHGLRLQLRS